MCPPPAWERGRFAGRPEGVRARGQAALPAVVAPALCLGSTARAGSASRDGATPQHLWFMVQQNQASHCFIHSSHLLGAATAPPAEESAAAEHFEVGRGTAWAACAAVVNTPDAKTNVAPAVNSRCTLRMDPPVNLTGPLKTPIPSRDPTSREQTTCHANETDAPDAEPVSKTRQLTVHRFMLIVSASPLRSRNRPRSRPTCGEPIDPILSPTDRSPALSIVHQSGFLIRKKRPSGGGAAGTSHAG